MKGKVVSIGAFDQVTNVNTYSESMSSIESLQKEI